ncbi:MAG: response regulator [Thaumarchaeota archaeon]|nr:response regulator [Nitrososphaerota archaeon]
MVEPTITAIVIDDDPDTVELFCEYLELKGIHVIGKGYDGKEAVELYQKMRPDIVFLDIMMPHYDGFYATKEIQKVDPNAKIIMVTADLTSDTAHRLEELRIPVVYKPYEFDDIMATISKLTQSIGHNMLM